MERMDTNSAIYSQLAQLDITPDLVKQVLPDWWDEEMLETSSGRLETQLMIGRFFNLDTHAWVTASAPTFRCHPVQYKAVGGALSPDATIARALATSASRIVAKAFAKPYTPFSGRAAGLRKHILDAGSSVVTTDSLVHACLEHGVPVLHLPKLPVKKPFAAMVTWTEGRPVIVLTQNKTSSWLLFHLAHEVAHILLGHLSEDGNPIVDADFGTDGAKPLKEQEADAEALHLLNGNAPLLMSITSYLPRAYDLAAMAKNYGRLYKVAPGHAVLRALHPRGKQIFGLANAALSELNDAPATLVSSNINTECAQHLAEDALSEDDMEFLTRLSNCAAFG